MPTHNPSDEEPVRCRARREYEDGLLNSRSNLFLVLNGLGAVALGLTSDHHSAQVAFCLAIIGMNTLWMVCGIQSWLVIRALTLKYFELVPDDSIDDLVYATLGKKKWQVWIRPTNIMALFLPVLLQMAWSSFAIVLLLKWVKI